MILVVFGALKLSIMAYTFFLKHKLLFMQMYFTLMRVHSQYHI